MLLGGNNTFCLYDVEERAPCPWSVDNPPSALPRPVTESRTPLESIAFPSDKQSAMLLYGQNLLVYVDLDLPVPDKCRVIRPDSVGANGAPSSVGSVKRKRSRSIDGADTNFTLIKTYRGLVHLSCATGNQLVSVL